MTISLCLIVKDEAANLPRCLDSAAAIVDEIVVVDTGSTDATVDIAAAHNARVFSIDWPNDFARSSQMSPSATPLATGYLVLDADEVLDGEVGQQLQQIDRGQPQQGIESANLLAVNLLRQEIGATQAPYTLITRFFRRLPTIQFFRLYHETVDDSIAALQQQHPRWQVLTLDQVGIYHTGYDPEVVIQRDKFSRAQSLMELHLQRYPQDPYILNKLAALYLEQNQSEAALSLLNRALDQHEALDALTGYELYYHRALALRHDHPDQAAKDYIQALQQNVPPRLKLGALINFGNLKKIPGPPARKPYLCFSRPLTLILLWQWPTITWGLPNA